MSENEKRLINANTNLQQENKYLKDDIIVLIRYIKGNMNYEYQVKNLMKKYEKFEKYHNIRGVNTRG